jgi:bifunctional non-homologous end joining protein LigD
MQDFPIVRLAIPTRAPVAFDHPDWIFELKHDGFRSLALIADGRCNLVSWKNNVYKSFKNLCAALAGLRVKTAILDCEICCLDDEGQNIQYLAVPILDVTFLCSAYLTYCDDHV